MKTVKTNRYLFFHATKNLSALNGSDFDAGFKFVIISKIQKLALFLELISSLLQINFWLVERVWILLSSMQSCFEKPRYSKEHGKYIVAIGTVLE